MDDITAHSGKKSAKITQNRVSAAASNVKAIYEDLNIEKNKTYTIAFWSKIDVSEGNERSIILVSQFQTSPFSMLLTKNVKLNEHEWKESFVTFNSPNDIDGVISIALWVGASDIDFWIDDFRFFEGELGDEVKSVETFISPYNKRTTTWGYIKSRQ